MIIGFGHRKQVGKNTAAHIMSEYIYQEHGISTCLTAFADPLYEIAYKLYGHCGFRNKHYYETHPKEKSLTLPRINKSPRQILIDLGTKGVREQVWDKTWVEYLINRSNYVGVSLVTDVRFPNEAEAIKETGGVLIKVMRPDIIPSDDEADCALENYFGWDYEIYNTGSANDLLPQVKEIFIDIFNTRALV